MLLPLLVSAQLAAAASAPGSITVRLGDREATVPVVSTNNGPALRADLVARGLGGSVRSMPNGHYAVSVPGAELDVTEQVPFAKVGEDVVPLVGPPFVDGGTLYVPFQFVAEVIPRVASGVLYDPSRAELRVFSATARGALITGSASAANAPRRRASSPAPVQRRAAQPELRATDAVDGPSPLRRRHVVVVDAGHGGPDLGMRGPLGGAARLREKDVTLAVAHRVAESLRARGIDVVMTRTRDTLIALSDRGRIANRNEADLFISIHVNAANPGWERPAAARGFETYFLAEAKTEDARRVEQMENESVRFETGAEAPAGDPLSFIIADMAQNEHLRESSDLAELMQQGMTRMHPGPSRGVKQANFAVLRTSFMPAVLVEIGFGTNPEEADFLNDPSRQRQIASAIATSTIEYLTRYERKLSLGQGDAP